MLLALGVLVGGLVLFAIIRRINWFEQLDWNDKLDNGSEYSQAEIDYFHARINGGLPYNAHTEIERAEGRLSVINDGYGGEGAPYEAWEQSRKQLNKKMMGFDIDYSDYEDIEGYLTEEEVSKLARKWY